MYFFMVYDGVRNKIEAAYRENDRPLLMLWLDTKG